MASIIEINDSDATKLLQSLSDFAEVNAKYPMQKAAHTLRKKLEDNIRQGKDISGNSYPVVKDITKEMEIARSGPFTDTRKRTEVSSNPIAMNVTGETADSLNVELKSNQEVNVGYDSGRTDVVLRGNAQHSGNVSKPVRDPVGFKQGIPSDFEFDAVADEIEKALDRLLNGF